MDLVDRLSWQIKDDARINRLARMVAVDDQQACLDWERNMAARDAKSAHRELWGVDTVEPDADGNQDAGDAMRVMAGGNVTVNHHAAPKPTEPVVTPVVPETPKPGMGTWAKLAAVGLAASGVGIPAAIGVSMLPQIISALRPGVVAAPTTQPPTGNLLRDYDLFVGEPEAPAPP